MTKACFRPFAPEDLPALQVIRAAAFAPVFASLRSIVGERIAALGLAGAEAEQAILLGTLAATAPGQLIVAMADDSIIGFAAYTIDASTRIGEIGLNAIDPAFSGCGIGTAMYAFVLDLMTAQGMMLATVGTGGDTSHVAARRAYAKAGFGPGIPTVYLYRAL